MKAGRSKLWTAGQWVMGVAAMAAPLLAFAQASDTWTNAPHRWQLNMGEGVTAQSMNAYSAHMLALWICIAIGILVFGAMAVAMFKFRHSKGAVPDKDFTHSTKLEIIWTVVPIVLLVLMAFPATSKLIKMYDTRESQMTVKVTGYQWMWKYEYLGEGVSYTSRLDRRSDQIRQSKVDARTANHPNYLLDVDNALVLPADTKVRFVITADDVIHAWWVPALGWKQDAIPGIVNEAWTSVSKPGVYRGQCAELCGKDHGFMPIVVRVLPKAEYAAWLAEQKAKNATAAPAAPAATPAEAAPAEAAPAAAAIEAPAAAAVAG
ncbi:cytochrome c oxidase subunit II [Lysobacter solisilvae (ex Woo and Kim 2020)]|uniref:Cytochrome c oxidase subunit 2 n=1 Tax=Agrilutibacter terrestris TaxID=2865112 RepID=A0A7H0G0K9_9GAMM|nr:cytochrome c oxidase subunit II [Lysobacter terrestris]QNP41825.1 cytochrome c oxidase subunit II [Lysobacter terrestris]